MEENKATEISTSDLWAVLKRAWILMLILAVIAGGSAFAVSYFTHESEYTSTAKIYVSRETGNAVTASDISIATTLIKDFIELNINDSIATHAKELSGSALSVPQLRRMADLTYTEGTRVMYVTVTASDPQTAQTLVNAFADAVCKEFNSLFDVEKEDGTVLTQKMLEVNSYGALNESPANPISLTPVWVSAAVAAFAVYVVFLIIHLARSRRKTEVIAQAEDN
ncbi:MAG: hypothetical protein IJW16_03660 [Clostridia bacterium]|nr:hypothetical protein [Clostridia bacterium]